MTTMKSMVTLAAFFAAAAAGAAPVSVSGIPASAYEQDGLINMWDATENAGAGLHDSEATVWKDLAGSLNMTMNLNGSTRAWTGNSLKVNGCTAYGATATAAYQTLEIVYKMTSGRILFASGVSDSSRFVLFDPAWTKVYSDGSKSTIAATYKTATDVIQSYTVCYDDANAVQTLALDGVVVENPLSHQNTWGIGEAKVMVGDRASYSYPWNGEVYCIRLYSRALKAEDIARNALIDTYRRAGDGYRWNDTTKKVEARTSLSAPKNGKFRVNGGELCASCEIWTAVDAAEGQVTVTPVADPDCAFRYWAGDTEGVSVAADGTATFDARTPRTLSCVFAGSSSIRVPGDFASLAEALASDDVQDGDVIQITPGTHAFARVNDATSGFTCLAAVRKGVTIRGSDDPSATVLDCSGEGGIVLDHSSAMLCGVTLTNFTTSVASPALDIFQGAATNVVVTGLGGSGSKRADVVRVEANGELRDSEISDLTSSSYSGYLIVVAGGVMRRTEVARSSINAIPIGAETTDGKNPLFEDCVFSGNRGYHGGVMKTTTEPRLLRCRFIGNYTFYDGGHALVVEGGKPVAVDCVFSNCVYTSTSSGALVQFPLMGGGSVVTMTNCLIVANQTYQSPLFYLDLNKAVSVSLVNCTVSGNSSLHGAVAAFAGPSGSSAPSKSTITLVNTILRDNLASGADVEIASDFTSVTTDHCCIKGATSAGGCIDADPKFEDAAGGDYTLKSGSPCVDAGVDIPALTWDLAGNARPLDGTGTGVAVTDIGCFERPESTIPLEVSLTVLGTEGIGPCDVTQQVAVTGTRTTGLSYHWEAKRTVGETVTVYEQDTSVPENVFKNLPVGAYTFKCTVTNDAVPPDSEFDETEDVFPIRPETAYVANDGSDEFPYDTPQKAARTLATAYANAGRRVVIRPGAYGFAHTTDAETSKDCQLAIRRGIAVTGADDPSQVILGCQGLGGFIVDHPEASVSGITLTNFLAAAGSGPVLQVDSGSISNIVVDGVVATAVAGDCVLLNTGTLATDVVVTNLHVQDWKGASTAFKLTGATLRRCAALGCIGNVGGSQSTATATRDADTGRRSRLEDCRFVGNYNNDCGGIDAKYTDLLRCSFERNSAYGKSAMLLDKTSTLSSCAVVGNFGGEGVIQASAVYNANLCNSMTNCLVACNRSSKHAAVCAYTGTANLELLNCTVVSNVTTAATGGGAVIADASASSRTKLWVKNCIVWDNTAAGATRDVANNAAEGGELYPQNSCFAEAAGFVASGCFAADPCFRSPTRGNFTLRPKSPCVDAGLTGAWTEADVDLAGQPRLKFRAVDLGCYECQQKATGLAIIMR